MHLTISLLSSLHVGLTGVYEGNGKNDVVCVIEEVLMLNADLVKGAKGAAAYCGLTERQIYHLAEQGLLPVIRKGKSLFFRKSELEAAFQSDTANG